MHISKKFWGIASINNLIDVEFVSSLIILLDNKNEEFNEEFIFFELSNWLSISIEI